MDPRSNARLKLESITEVQGIRDIPTSTSDTTSPLLTRLAPKVLPPPIPSPGKEDLPPVQLSSAYLERPNVPSIDPVLQYVESLAQTEALLQTPQFQDLLQ